MKNQRCNQSSPPRAGGGGGGAGRWGEPKTYIIVEEFMCECVPRVALLLVQPSGHIWSKWKQAFPYHIFCFVLISILLRKFKELANTKVRYQSYHTDKTQKKASRMRIKVYTCLMIISQCYKFPMFFWHVKEFNATIFKHDLQQKIKFIFSSLIWLQYLHLTKQKDK